MWSHHATPGPVHMEWPCIKRDRNPTIRTDIALELFSINSGEKPNSTIFYVTGTLRVQFKLSPDLIWPHLCLCSEDSCEDVMSSGEESLSSSLGSDAEGQYFPLHLRRQKHHLAWCRHVPRRLHPPPLTSLIYCLFSNEIWWRITQLAAEQSRLFLVDLVDF